MSAGSFCPHLYVGSGKNDFSFLMQVTTFSAYCERKFEVEPVEVISFDGNSSVYPDLSEYNMEVPLSYITGSIGVPLEVDEVLLPFLFPIYFFIIFYDIT